MVSAMRRNHLCYGLLFGHSVVPPLYLLCEERSQHLYGRLGVKERKLVELLYPDRGQREQRRGRNQGWLKLREQCSHM